MQSRINHVKFKEGLPLEIEILPIADTILNHHQTITSPHRAEFYHIFWVQKGTAEYLVDFEPVHLKAGDFLFINKDRVQAIDQGSKHDGSILLFTDSFFGKSEEDAKYLQSTILFNDLLDIPVIDVKANASLQTIFNAIKTELTKDNDPYQTGADMQRMVLC